MKQHEREYFVSRIRAGYHPIKTSSGLLKVYAPDIEQEFELNSIYMESYANLVSDGIKTEEEMLEWMAEKEIWTSEDNEKLKKSEDDLDKLKVELFKSRFDIKKKDYIRKLLRGCEKHINKLLSQKTSMFDNTCEVLAHSEKSYAMIKMCTYLNGELFSFETELIEDISNIFSMSLLSIDKIRDLARNDPWRSSWTLFNTIKADLFKNSNLNIDQKNIIVWSRMYDNIQEHPECPEEDVINDDDMLDGWMIIQRNKRQQEINKAAFDSFTNNEKIKNSSEIFIPAKSKEEAARINSLNSQEASFIKNERIKTVKENGEVKAGGFNDEKLEISQMANGMLKSRFRR